MKKFESYEKVEAYQDVEKLPPGGYIIGILGATEKTESWGDILEIAFDISEGEHKNYYSNQYKNNTQSEDKKFKGIYRMNVPKEDGTEQDTWTARRFKTDMMAIEASNPGFHWDWDEKKLIGKAVGAIFFEKEYDFQGKQGFFATPHSFKDVESIRSGKFKVPKPKLLKDKPGLGSNFEDLDIKDGDLPF